MDSDSKTYSGFAFYYDSFMSDIPYDEWAEKICMMLKNEGITDGIVCELGCGTGEMTMRLSEAGYDMIGIDLSEEMLGMALDKLYGEGDEPERNILYLRQDMRKMELYGTVRAFVSVCDSMNYITEKDDLTEIFRKVNNYLDPGGLFIFDMKSDFFYHSEYADNEFRTVDEESQALLVWKNHYDTEKKLNTYELSIEEPDYENPGKTIVTKEKHIQRAYEQSEILECAETAGLEFVRCLDAEKMGITGPETRRYYYIFREKRQENKLYI